VGIGSGVVVSKALQEYADRPKEVNWALDPSRPAAFPHLENT
jgi:hypothetical protein